MSSSVAPGVEGLMCILAPAKGQDFETPYACTLPPCEEVLDATRTREVARAMKAKKPAELKKLLALSDAQVAHGF